MASASASSTFPYRTSPRRWKCTPTAPTTAAASAPIPIRTSGVSKPRDTATLINTPTPIRITSAASSSVP